MHEVQVGGKSVGESLLGRVVDAYVYDDWASGVSRTLLGLLSDDAYAYATHDIASNALQGGNFRLAGSVVIPGVTTPMPPDFVAGGGSAVAAGTGEFARPVLDLVQQELLMDLLGAEDDWSYSNSDDWGMGYSSYSNSDDWGRKLQPKDDYRGMYDDWELPSHYHDEWKGSAQ